MARLGGDDSIFTFNCDTAVELLHLRVGNMSKAASIAGVSGTADDRDREDQARAAGLPSLYKLHGSVNWSYNPEGIQMPQWSPEMLNGSVDLAIVTPGESKIEMAGGLFRLLWDKAFRKLEEADQIYILGFRFPQSDAFPRDRLLAAVRGNRNPHLQVHVVLGPSDSPDKKRVMTLLEWTCNLNAGVNLRGGISGRCLVNHTLWAEDYLTVWAGAREE